MLWYWLLLVALGCSWLNIMNRNKTDALVLFALGCSWLNIMNRTKTDRLLCLSIAGMMGAKIGWTLIYLFPVNY
jgi:hypothetical protein